MKTERRVLVTMIVLVGLIAGLYVFSAWFSKTTGYVLGEDEKIRIAQCLAANNTILYEGESCWECEQQKAILGEGAYKIIPKIQCNEGSCSGIAELPAWQIHDQFYYGKREFKELISLSNCSIT